MTFGATSHGTSKPLAGFLGPLHLSPVTRQTLTDRSCPCCPLPPIFRSAIGGWQEIGEQQFIQRLLNLTNQTVSDPSFSIVLPFHDETLAFSAGLSRAVIFRPPSCLSPAGLPSLHIGLRRPRSSFILDKLAEKAKTLTLEWKDRFGPSDWNKPALIS